MIISLCLRSVAFSPAKQILKTSLFAQRKTISSAFATSAVTNMPQYWNREDSTPQAFAKAKSVCKQAKIISLSDAGDPANAPLHKGDLPDGASLLAVGTTVEEFDISKLQEEKPNVLFVSHPLVGIQLKRFTHIMTFRLTTHFSTKNSVQEASRRTFETFAQH
jgi:hypothetical protein